MQLNQNILKAGAAVIVFGIVILVLTYAVELFVPLIGLAIVVVLGYLMYKAAKDQGMF